MFEIGSSLREARVRKRLTLQQVEEDTKIRCRYLQALEDDDFQVIPGHAYVKGFLHSYAAYLGLDPKVFIDEYNSRYMGQPQDQFAGPSALRRPAISHRKSGLIFFAVVAVLVLATFYLVGLGGCQEEAPPKVDPSAIATPSVTPSPHVSPTQSPSPAVTGASTVIVEATGASCYIEVFSGSLQNAAIYADTLAQNERKTFTPRGTLYVRVGGNPSALTIWLNDEKVSTSGDDSGVVYQISRGQVTKQ